MNDSCEKSGGIGITYSCFLNHMTWQDFLMIDFTFFTNGIRPILSICDADDFWSHLLEIIQQIVDSLSSPIAIKFFAISDQFAFFTIDKKNLSQWKKIAETIHTIGQLMTARIKCQ